MKLSGYGTCYNKEIIYLIFIFSLINFSCNYISDRQAESKLKNILEVEKISISHEKFQILNFDLNVTTITFDDSKLMNQLTPALIASKAAFSYYYDVDAPKMNIDDRIQVKYNLKDGSNENSFQAIYNSDELEFAEWCFNMTTYYVTNHRMILLSKIFNRIDTSKVDVESADSLLGVSLKNTYGPFLNTDKMGFEVLKTVNNDTLLGIFTHTYESDHNAWVRTVWSKKDSLMKDVLILHETK